MTNAAAEVQSEPAASPRIEHAARQVAEGEDAVGFLRATADKAAEVVAKLDARISALAAKRAALIDRRVAGEGDDDEDASALALIDADLERLQQLRILAARDHTNAARAVDERALHLRDARRELDAATATDAATRFTPASAPGMPPPPKPAAEKPQPIEGSVDVTVTHMDTDQRIKSQSQHRLRMSSGRPSGGNSSVSDTYTHSRVA